MTHPFVVSILSTKEDMVATTTNTIMCTYTILTRTYICKYVRTHKEKIRFVEKCVYSLRTTHITDPSHDVKCVIVFIFVDIPQNKSDYMYDTYMYSQSRKI
jgi:hypothetical protein